MGEGAPPRADLGAGIAVAAASSQAGPARRALGWAAARAAARAGAPRAPPRPAAAPRNLQEATGPGEWGEGSLEGRWGPGGREADVPSGGARGRQCKGGGEAGEPQDPAATLSSGRRVAAALLSFCLPDSDLASPGPGRSGRASHADGEISRWGASSDSIFIQPRDVSERLPGTAQYGEQSFSTVPEGGEQASAAWWSGAAAQATAARVCFPTSEPPRRQRPHPT